MKIKKIIGKIISVSLIVVAVYSAVPVFGASVGIAWSGYANTSVAIIKTGTSYGVALYDHIALEGNKIQEDELIK